VRPDIADRRILAENINFIQATQDYPHDFQTGYLKLKNLHKPWWGSMTYKLEPPGRGFT
jgi:hypothetical protein